MAIIRTNKNTIDTAAVTEDPTPGQSKLYFWHDGYDFNTLSPLFDQGINHFPGGNLIEGFGRTRSIADNMNSGHLFLPNDVTTVDTRISTVNTANASLDVAPFISLDPDRQPRNIRYDSLGNNSILYMNWVGPNAANGRTISAARFNARSLQDLAFRRTDSSTLSSYPIYFNPGTGNMILATSVRTTDSPSTFYGARITTYMSQTHTFSNVTGVSQRSGEFLGVDGGGRALFFLNSASTDYDHLIVRYLDVDNTATVLATINAVPSAGGTSAGGNRGTNFGNNFPKHSSKTFPDPADANNVNRAWYTPYQDVNGRYHPLYFQWNRSADTFTRSTDITVNWGAGRTQDDVWTHDTFSTTSSTGNNQGYQKILFNDTFVVNGIRYITLMQLHGATGLFDNQPKMRTFVTFAIDVANPKILNYHSHIIIPSTPKNIIWLNTAKTLLGVIANTQFYTYSFNPTSGWVLTATLPFQFMGVGRDSTNRIWAVAPGPNTWGEIHLITVNVPVSITVTAPQISYNFTGAVINTNLTVNAYDTTGLRIATAVKLVIDGGSMAFAGANLTTTVTTSTSADTLVPVAITGGGLSNIIASVVL